MTYPDGTIAPEVESAPLGAFVSLTMPGLATGRDGTPRVVQAEIDLEGLPRRVDPTQARALAAALEIAAASCEEANLELLPPLREFVLRCESREES